MRVYGIRFFLFLLAAALLTGCARGGASHPTGLLAETAGSVASFTVVFPSATNLDEAVRCAGEKLPDGVTLTVLAPERSAGLIVTLALREDGEGFAVSVSGPEFPDPAVMDPAAARALTDIFAALYGPGISSDGSAVRQEYGGVYRAEAGGILPTVRRIGGKNEGKAGKEETAFLFPSGAQLVFGENGLPVRVECPDLSGSLRTVVFEEYRLIP